MIKFISTEQTLAIRNAVLREGKLSLEECRFPNDEAEGAFHLGCFQNEGLVCIATFHPQTLPNYQGKAYQLRGMATVPAFRKKGFGNRLVNFAIVYLRGQKVNYLWCNARKNACNFYQQLGFEFISDEFEIAEIGPHRTMYLKIQ